MPRIIAATFTALAVALAIACGNDVPVATPTATPASTTAVATSAPATTSPPTASGTAAATATRTPAVPSLTPGAIFLPNITPTPAIPGEPIAGTANIPRASLPVAEFSRGGNVTATLPIEVPPRDQYSIGLSGRRTLGDERGMLFHYADKGGSFWMKNTHINLSIAFVARDETIVDIRDMEAESTTLVTPRADYQYAIEAPADWYLRHSIRIGDRARLAFPLPHYLAN